MKREWIANRNAYAPKFWPQAVISLLIVIPVVVVLRVNTTLPWWVFVLGACVVGVVVDVIWWGAWKHKHPPLG
jgi:protein-S-isoprenylcysteine O-methyltransferase Ste14